MLQAAIPPYLIMLANACGVGRGHSDPPCPYSCKERVVKVEGGANL